MRLNTVDLVYWKGEYLHGPLRRYHLERLDDIKWLRYREGYIALAGDYVTFYNDGRKKGYQYIYTLVCLAQDVFCKFHLSKSPKHYMLDSKKITRQRPKSSPKMSYDDYLMQK